MVVGALADMFMRYAYSWVRERDGWDGLGGDQI